MRLFKGIAIILLTLLVTVVIVSADTPSISIDDVGQVTLKGNIGTDGDVLTFIAANGTETTINPLAINHVGEITVGESGAYSYTFIPNHSFQSNKLTLLITDTSGNTEKTEVDYNSEELLINLIRGSKNIETVSTLLTNFRDMLIQGDSGMAATLNQCFQFQEKMNYVSGKLRENPPTNLADLKTRTTNTAQQFDNSNKVNTTISPGRVTGGGSTQASNLAFDNQILPTSTPQPITFSDIDTVPWSKDSVLHLASIGVINGYGKEFRPNNSITRGEFIKIMVSALGFLDQNASADYQDVSLEHWAYKYIASATQKGIVNGVGSKIFGVDEKISRQDMMVILHRIVDKTGRELPKRVEKANFSDELSIAEYAARAVEAMQQAGIINGFEDGSFGPTKNATRAEAAKIIHLFLTENN